MKRLLAVPIAAAGLVAVVALAAEREPYSKPEGTLTKTPFTQKSPDTWALITENPNKMPLGEEVVNRDKWSHKYTQADCPNGYTILNANGVVVDEYNTRTKPTFVKKNMSNGMFDGTILTPAYINNIDNPKEQRIQKFQFVAKNNANYWQAVMQTATGVLMSFKIKSTAQEGPWPAHDHALILFNPWKTVDPIDVCVRQQGNPPPPSSCDNNNICNDAETCEYCPSDCGACPYCGDGTVQSGEQCDDGNMINGDGCSAECVIVEEEEEEELPVGICGDGVLHAGEYCDDGNNTNGDGCSESCVVEISSSASSFAASSVSVP